MQQSLEHALDLAEDVIESVQLRPPKRESPPSGEKSLHQKLYDIYVEECNKEPEVTEELRSNVNLLEKLLKRESLSCLVVNLYPGDKGYSLMLESRAGSFAETIQLPYRERELLDYLDAEELPPVLLDVLEKSQLKVFHCGCVIAEIRDYRQCGDMEQASYQSRHILLRPTMQTLVCDIESMTSDDLQRTQEEKLDLESKLLLATAEPLCLDPSVMVTCTANRLLYNKQKMNTNPMRRCLKRYSWSSLSLRQSQQQAPPELRPLTACQERKEGKAAPQDDLQMPKAGQCVDTCKQRPCESDAPSQVDVEQDAQGKQSVESDDLQATVWPALELGDDFGFERESGSQLRETKLSFMESLDDPFSFDNTGPGKGDSCEIQLYPPHITPADHSDGWVADSKTDAGAVSVSQKSVKSKVKHAGKMPRGCSSSASPSQPCPGKKPRQRGTRWMQSSVAVKVVNPPALPMTLPSRTLQLFSGNSSSTQPARSLRKLPLLAPAPKPGDLPQKPPVGVSSRGAALPPATKPRASSSAGFPATKGPVGSSGLKVINVVSPVQGAQVLVSGPNPVLGSSTSTSAPMGIHPRGPQPPAGQQHNAQPCATQSSAQTGVQVILNNTSSPITVLQLPPGSLIVNPMLPQPPLQPQPQVQPPAQLIQLVPQQQPQQPLTCHPPQPGPQASVQDSDAQQWALAAQPAVVINLTRGSGFLQPQSAALLGSGQQRPGQQLPPQGIQFSPFPQGQLQPQLLPQNLQLTLVSVATVPALTAHPRGFGHTASQAKNKRKSRTPKV